MDRDCLVSVLVLSYNHEKYVREALDSILAQKCDFEIEIVVGEDGSSDNTRNIILEYEKKYPSIIKLSPAEKNKGVMRNYRDTLKRCAGKYIAICSADDYWHDPLKLEKQINFLEKHVDYGMVHTDTDFYFQGSGKTIKNSNTRMQPFMPEGDVFESLIANRFYIVTASVCFRRDLLVKYVDVDDFIQNGFVYEDLATWLELAKHSKVKYLSDSTATYRLLPDSIAHTTDKSRKLNFLKSHYGIKLYFLNKYQVRDAIREEFLISYHKKKFDMAYNWSVHPELLDSFKYLYEKRQTGIKHSLKKIISSNPGLHRIVKSSKRILAFKGGHSDFS